MKEKIYENMMVKLLVQRKKLKQALDSNKFLEEDLKKTLEEEKENERTKERNTDSTNQG